MEFFGPFSMFTVHKCSDRGLLGRLSNAAFCSLDIQKQIIFQAHLFLKVFEVLYRFRKWRKKLRKFFLILR